MNRRPIRRHAHKDPVTPEMRQAVLERDGRTCVKPKIEPNTPDSTCFGPLTLDHVRDFAMLGKRAPSDMAHLVTICWNHHIIDGWATSHRPELRAYLEAVNERS